MPTAIKKRAQDLVFWLTVFTAIGAVACGYGRLMSTQRECLVKIEAIDKRVSRVEGKVDELLMLRASIDRNLTREENELRRKP